MVSSPKRMIQMATKIWSKYYSFGEFKVVELGDDHAIGRIVNTDFSDPLLCERIRGWMESVIMHSGGKSAKVKHTKCISYGDPYEEYQGKWK